MPAPQQSLIVTAPTTALSFSLEPAQNAFHSLVLLSKVEHLSGLSQWVDNTIRAMSDEEYARHRLVIIGFYFAIQPQQSWPSFPAYLDHLASLSPEAIVDRLLNMYARIPPCNGEEHHEFSDQPLPLDRQVVLATLDNYLNFLYERFTPEGVEEDIETEAYRLLTDPPMLQQLLVSHLRHMWTRYLQAEWQRVQPMLQNAIDAFAVEDLSDMTRLEAASFVTGQDLEDERWDGVLQQAREIVFVPSAHVGPYLGRFWHNGTLGIIFGARLPAGTQIQAPDLSRAEIVVRLSALADDTRLSILKLVATAGEMRSQEIMERLELSQSAASRHLKQLTATGYLSERRCAGAKCYRLNADRVDDTLEAIGAFLLGREDR